jgi:hypothetical protein
MSLEFSPFALAAALVGLVLVGVAYVFFIRRELR